MHMNFNQHNKKRKATLEQALLAHQKNKKMFWEVYSGSGNLAATMAAEGWEVMCFDIKNGWNFELAQHRREFLQLQQQVCPKFVWLAPPCTVWPSLQNLNVSTPERQEALDADRDFQEAFIKQVERAWIRDFGPIHILQVDEHRAWSSDEMREWCTEQGIQLAISPGQSHTRLAILERQHQVTRRAVSIFLQSNPTVAADDDGLITALNYVAPQINRTPNVCGFSPIQWTLGYTPHIPGLLMEEQTGDNPAHLPSQRFMEKLRLQQETAKAMPEADGDRRLRRALLRKSMGKQAILGPGDLYYYWRYAPTGSTAKLRWRRPATVIMREPGLSGPNTDVHWLGHGTVLLHAAPEHIKPAQAAHDLSQQPKDPLTTAKESLQNIRNRGVTNYVDLGKTNKAPKR
eukprot:s3002_g5.t1